MRISLSLIILFFLGDPLNAQEGPIIEFEISKHDFGIIQEERGPVTIEFMFKNKGNEPLTISDVKASCGCTTPGWTRQAVAPGAIGFVKAQYNPKGRPGPFNKSLTVTTNSVQPLKVLYIKGEVTPKPRTPKDDFPRKIGKLRVKYASLSMGTIKNNGIARKSFDIYNDSDTVVTFKPNMITPDHVTITISPMALEPQQKGKIEMAYDASMKNDLGYMSDQVILFTDDSDQPDKKFNLMATIEEYFPPMTKEELARAPKISFNKKEHDFGTIKAGEIMKANFIITNSGKEKLLIRKTKASCGCTLTKPKKNSLEPGETTELAVSFNSTGRKGNQYKSIAVFSNDPSGPTQRLSIRAKVRE